MRAMLVVVWLLVPVVAGAYHYGPGQQRTALDEATALMKAADAHAAASEWNEAIGQYNSALNLLPQAQTEAVRRVRLERAKAQMFAAQLPEAHEELTMLIDELAEDQNADPELVSDTREALASSQYYLTWLLRLEGATRVEWEPEIEAARQNYRLLSEQAAAAGESESAESYQEDLEATIRLARMDLSDLQALPLPSQCKGCKSGQCKGKGRCKSKNQGERDARGAGSGPPPDGQGS